MLADEQIYNCLDHEVYAFDLALLEFARKIEALSVLEEREACAKVRDEIAIKHQKDEGTYSAGKKAGAFECAETLRSNVQYTP